MVADLWVETGFGGSAPEQMVQGMQRSGMTKNQALIMMYRNGFRPFCAALTDSMRVSGEENFIRSTVRGTPGGMDNLFMNYYQKAVQRFLEREYGKEVSDFVLPRFNSDNPI